MLPAYSRTVVVDIGDQLRVVDCKIDRAEVDESIQKESAGTMRKKTAALADRIGGEERGRGGAGRRGHSGSLRPFVIYG